MEKLSDKICEIDDLLEELDTVSEKLRKWELNYENYSKYREKIVWQIDKNIRKLILLRENKVDKNLTSQVIYLLWQIIWEFNSLDIEFYPLAWILYY